MATWAVSGVCTAKCTKNKFLKDKQKRLGEKNILLRHRHKNAQRNYQYHEKHCHNSIREDNLMGKNGQKICYRNSLQKKCDVQSHS